MLKNASVYDGKFKHHLNVEQQVFRLQLLSTSIHDNYNETHTKPNKQHQRKNTTVCCKYFSV